MKYKLFVVITVLSIFMMSISSCMNKNDVSTWDKNIDSTYVANRSIEFGQNVFYIEATNDQFGIQLQKWIKDNPTEVVTSIAVDTKEYGHNDPIVGYYIIHYPDSIFNPFKTR